MKDDTVSRQAAIDALADMHCKSDEDGYVWIIRSDAWARIDALPSAQPKRTCVNCGRTINNGGWYADGGNEMPDRRTLCIAERWVLSFVGETERYG